ncbi:MAG: winged helix-turn-helix transcriptional regulator [Caldilineae bacterium]|nr:winged helix-turn-helix transcriptional regulator [Caldilineae bacterium]
MTEHRAYRTPFVLGKPIKNPADFYGRKAVLREAFAAAVAGQRVSIVGEHRCGNTSIIYQMMDADVRAEHLAPAEEAALCFAFVSSQLASDGPEALLRRIGRALRRADPDASVDFNAETIDRQWLVDYLEDLADRDRRLVLLMDEFEVLAGFEPSFWEWFEVLVNEYDIAIIATSRFDLSEYRTEKGDGPPFFNTIRSIYIGSFSPATVDFFLADKTELTDFDFMKVKDVIGELAGRFPFYMQVASALFYFHAGGESHVTPEQIETIRREFATQTGALFDDAWPKLPESERIALTWLAIGADPADALGIDFDKALRSLERRGYVVDGRIFSSAFTDYIRRQLRRIELNAETGRVRAGRRLVDLPPKERALLAYLIDHRGLIVSRDDIAEAVWPEYDKEPMGVSDAMIEKTISRLRKELEAAGGDFEPLESIRGQGYRFQNPAMSEAPTASDAAEGLDA